MVEHIVETSRPRGRVEIRTGVDRRRVWSAEAKGRIVAASLMPGAVVSEVARRHEISPQHLFAWRREARRGRLVLPARDDEPLFVPVVTTAPPAVARRKPPKSASIAIEVAGMVVRVEAGVDVDWLARVLRAVKAAA